MGLLGSIWGNRLARRTLKGAAIGWGSSMLSGATLEGDQSQMAGTLMGAALGAGMHFGRMPFGAGNQSLYSRIARQASSRLGNGRMGWMRTAARSDWGRRFGASKMLSSNTTAAMYGAAGLGIGSASFIGSSVFSSNRGYR